MQAPQPRKVILHIGWPKTGTSTLQKHVLPKVPAHRYLGKTPFEAERNRFFFDLVHLLAYCSAEKFRTSAPQLLHDLHALERERYGDVDPQLPLILSEEGVLSSLLKPSHHQHHGHSTASLDGIVMRLKELEALWGVSFDILLTERDPVELLHSYYAQMYHLFRRMPDTNTFQRYVEAGVRDRPSADLGFRYLRPGLVHERLTATFGERVHRIHMNELFAEGRVRLNAWYAPWADVDAEPGTVENRRGLAPDVKLTHQRPLWVGKRPFRPLYFLRRVLAMYREEHAEHRQLEVQVRLTAEDRDRLARYLETDG